MKPIKTQIRLFGLLRYDVTLLFYYFSAMVEIAWISTRKQDFCFLFHLDCFFMNILLQLEFFLHKRCINDNNMICLKLPTLWPLSKIVYMCSSLLHLAVESHDLKFINSEKATKFCKISTVDWLALHKTDLRCRFCKILCPSQNIWTLTRMKGCKIN